jgi:hypothetical protein
MADEKKLVLILIVSVLLQPFIIRAEGKWLEDKKTGCKAYVDYTSQNTAIFWSGNCKNGKAHGKGVLRLYRESQLESTYNGEMKYGKMDGYGIYTTPDGHKYEGQWKNNLQNGNGIYIWPYGKKYEGQWKDGGPANPNYKKELQNVDEEELDTEDVVKGLMVVGAGLSLLSKTLDSDADSSSDGSSNISPSSSKGQLIIKVSHEGFFSTVELEKYVVKVKRTHKLDGGDAYDNVDEKNGSGNFLRDPATFYYKNYGYYEVECYGFDKFEKKVFYKKWVNIKHTCKSTNVTIYSNSSRSPYVVCY